MSYESSAEPIRVGYLMDFTLPPGFPEELFASFTQTFYLIFEQAVEQGLMDRSVQMIYREVEGLPKGSVKAVIDAYGELVDEGCLVVFGPSKLPELGKGLGEGIRGFRDSIKGGGDAEKK